MSSADGQRNYTPQFSGVIPGYNVAPGTPGQFTGQLQQSFDLTIRKIDRNLSEFLLLYAPDIDEANRQTLKHHADDLIGVGQAILKKLNL